MLTSYVLQYKLDGFNLLLAENWLVALRFHIVFLMNARKWEPLTDLTTDTLYFSWDRYLIRVKYIARLRDHHGHFIRRIKLILRGHMAAYLEIRYYDSIFDSDKVSISWTIMSTESNNNFHAVTLYFSKNWCHIFQIDYELDLIGFF